MNKALEYGLLGLLLACAAVVGYLNYLTPIHSDDYFYSSLGLGKDIHLAHYLRWSGRVVADYISPLLLSIPSRPVLAAVQTGGLFLMILTLARAATLGSLPAAVRDGEPSRQRGGSSQFLLVASVLLLVYVFFLPAFGQVNFWVVGSANYMWMAVLYSAYIYQVLAFYYGKPFPWYAYPLALLAGCTNESAAATLGLAPVGFVAYCYITGRRARLGSLLAVCLLFILGAVVLIGSPGNQVRLEHPAFEWFTAMSLWEKIQRFVLETLPEVFAQLYPIYVISLGLLAASLVLQRREKTQLVVQLVFIFLSLASIASMVLSPSFSPRTMTVPFVLNLVAIGVGVSCLAGVLGGARAPGAAGASGAPAVPAVPSVPGVPAVSGIAAWGRPLKVGLGMLACGGVLAILLMTVPGYRSLNDQQHFRESLIAAAEGGPVQIPAFYYPPLPRESFLIDTYVNVEAMAEFYEVESIEEFRPGFDFGLMHRYGRREGVFIDPLRDESIAVKQTSLDPGQVWRAEFNYTDGTSEVRYAYRYMPLGDQRYYYVSTATSNQAPIDSVRLLPLDLQDFQEGRLLGSSPASDHGELSVYLQHYTLLFVSQNCSSELVEDTFFVHVYPQVEQILDERGIDAPFENLDFRFDESKGYHEGSYCFVARELPGYPIERIRTGQFNAQGEVWSLEHAE